MHEQLHLKNHVYNRVEYRCKARLCRLSSLCSVFEFKIWRLTLNRGTETPHMKIDKTIKIRKKKLFEHFSTSWLLHHHSSLTAGSCRGPHPRFGNHCLKITFTADEGGMFSIEGLNFKNMHFFHLFFLDTFSYFLRYQRALLLHHFFQIFFFEKKIS